MHVTIRQLRALLAVSEFNSFSAAAKAMSISQAALSGLIKELETQVGVRLLDRDTRNVCLSEVGMAFEPTVRRLVADLDDALHDLRNLKELKKGVVRLAAPETLSCTLVPELIEVFHQKYPGVDVRFDDIPMEPLRAGLENGSIDIGLAPGGAIKNPGIQETLLWRDPLWVAMSANDPLAQQAKVSWSDIQNHHMYTYMRQFEQSVLVSVPSAHRPRHITPVQRVNTAFAMTQIGQSATVFPSMAQNLPLAFGLKCLPLTGPVVEREIAMFARNTGQLSPAAIAFQQVTLAFARDWIYEKASL